jgi:hypothetical protein
LKKNYWQCFLIAAVALLGTRGARAADSPITPYVDAQTTAVIHLDLSNLDMDQVGTWEQKAISSISDPTQRAKAQDDATKGIVSAKKWISDFKTAGGTDLYVVVSLAGLMQGTPGGLIVPLNGSDGSALAKVFNPNGNPPPADPNDPNSAQQARMRPQTAVAGDMLIYSTGTGITKLKTPSTEARADLTDALAAGTGTTVRLALTPSTVKNNPLFGAILNSRMGANGGASQTPPLSEPQWDNVTWMSVSVSAPPKEGGNCTFQCKDADSATALADLLAKKIADGKAGFLNNGKMSPDDYAKFAAAIKPAVSGTQVVISLDQDTIDNIIVPIMSKSMQASQPAATPPPPADNNNGGM